MDQATTAPFTLGDWSVDPALNCITRDGETIRLEPRTMRLLTCLADRAGQVVSADDLLDQVWPNVIVTPDSVYQAVAALRRLLGDNPKEPRYIVTVPKQGYRMVASVKPAMLVESSFAAPISSESKVESATPRRRYRIQTWRAVAILFPILIGIGLLGWYTYRSQPAPATTTQTMTVAVLPFLDLTESMGEEVFADGMTEELIDKFSQIPGLRVPSPTASFFFKDKQLTVADVAGKLGVAYVVDGSVRKSGAMLRVAARLVRASDGFVVWSETYDRPSDDKLMIQDDIASAVQKALRATIERNAAR
jgi:transcriptional activator of cad operon